MDPIGAPTRADDPDLDLDPGLDPDRRSAGPEPPRPGLAGAIDGLRDRFGGRVPLDGRLVGWVVTVVVAAAVSWWLLRPADPPFEETLPRVDAAAIGAPEGDAATAADGTAGNGGDEADGRGATGDRDRSGGVGEDSTAGPEEVVAHAAGAVNAPGVYRLPVGARVDDLVHAAGGLAPDADPQRINLAARLADGSRLYVPRVGEPDPPAVVGPDGAPPADGAGGSSDGGTAAPLVDLNAADEAELDTLPGVGPATAAAIVTFRDENGPFGSVDELLDVPGIGEAKLERIRPLVTV